jgi:hypothetical protein
MSTRSRAYLVSQRPLDEPVDGRYEFGCNCYSSGETQNVEGIMPSAWASMLRWLNVMHENPGYGEVDRIVVSNVNEEQRGPEE